MMNTEEAERQENPATPTQEDELATLKKELSRRDEEIATLAEQVSLSQLYTLKQGESSQAQVQQPEEELGAGDKQTRIAPMPKKAQW